MKEEKRRDGMRMCIEFFQKLTDYSAENAQNVTYAALLAHAE
jgi:hypothetical protein